MKRHLSNKMDAQGIWLVTLLNQFAVKAFENSLRFVIKQVLLRTPSKGDWQPLCQVCSFVLLLFIVSLTQVSCGGGGESENPPPTIRTVNISWGANRETAVNTEGGGYKVYYSTKAGFNISDAGVTEVDVPYVAPPLVPTSITLQLESGQYYFRVVAYSALTPPWGFGGTTSAPSGQVSLVVP